MVGSNDTEQPRHAVLHHTTVINQPAVCLVTVKPIELGVGVTDGKVLCQLSVCNEMLPMRRIVPINRECCIASPFATFVHSTRVDTTGTMPSEPNATGHSDKQEQRRCDQTSHPRTPCSPLLWHICKRQAAVRVASDELDTA